MKKFIFFSALVIIIYSLQAQTTETLNEKEEKEGWKSLFNGKNFEGWHAYGGKAIGPRWTINKGVIELNTGLQDGGDLVTDEIIKGDFELKIEWKIKKSSNSGIFFFVTDSPQYKFIYNTALELQIQDNEVYRNEKEDKKHLTGDLFGIAKATNTRPKKLGEWNEYHVIFRYPILDIFLNSERIHHINLKGAAWQKALIQGDRSHYPFASGQYTGPIGLQDWHSPVQFRNIRIRR